MRSAMAIAATVLVVSLGTAMAQINGFPPSVTSLGPRNIITAPPASVTSLGPLGFHGSIFGPNFSRFPGAVRFGHNPRFNVFFGSRFHHRSFRGFSGLAAYYVPYAYAEPYPVAVPMEVEPDYEPPAPTVFERRPANAWSDRDRYGEHYLDSREQARSTPPPETASAAKPDAKPQPAEMQPATILIFRDGHRLEVRNYAIVGPTVINLSGSGPRKIPLAELDVDATAKENDDRGVDFKLPAR